MTFFLRHSIFFFMIFTYCAMFSQNIDVCKSCSLTSIKEAIASAKDFDTITIKKGVYKEHNIVINKSIHLIGENNPVIDGEFKETIIKISAKEFSIEGLTLINVGQSYVKDYAAILVSKSHNFSIKNNILKDVFFGFLIEKSHYGKVLNNMISSHAVNEANSGNGIHLWHCSNMTIESNKVSGLRDGIYFEFVKNSTIFNNISQNNIRYGLHFMFSNEDVYEQNIFKENGAGVAVMFSKKIKMIGNKFQNNWGSASYGLLLKEINDAEIIGNLFKENTIGINVDGSNRITYKNNNFISNGWALKVLGACYANAFLNNNFLYNSFDVSYNSKINDNTFDNNFWSNYTGYDLDKNGIGDVPYRPVKLFSYIVNRTPETIILLRSLFIDIIDFSEKVSPVFTPDNLLDNYPLIKKITW